VTGLLAGKRIGLLTASASRLGGGVFEAVAAQAALLQGLDSSPVIFALHDEFSEADAGRFAGCELHHAPVLGPRLVGFAPQLGGILDAARLDLLHLHGIWMYPSAAGSAWAARSGKPYLISPHGMLDPWITGRGRWKKALARVGYERRGWRRATAFHALTEREAADIARETGRDDCLVIANAGPRPSQAPSAMRPPTVLYLGRIHPKKNVAALIDAWARLESQRTLPDGARLVIAGWGEPQDLANLNLAMAGAPASATFVGPQFGADKARLLAEARFMALPSFSEGLPMAILEAWAAGTPALMSEACNLPTGFAAGAAREISTDSADLAPQLAQALNLSADAWLAMSRAAHDLAAGPFSAEAIAAQWEAAYAGLMQGMLPQ
jgi:glycosyltransferase involved in cell wall biosynthesis